VYSTKANIGKEIINGLVVFHIREKKLHFATNLERKNFHKGCESGQNATFSHVISFRETRSCLLPLLAFNILLRKILL